MYIRLSGRLLLKCTVRRNNGDSGRAEENP